MILRVIVAFVVLSAWYLLFVGQVSGTEAIAGGGACVAAALYAGALHRAASRRLDLGAPWGRLAAYVATSVVMDTLRVAAALFGRGGDLAREKFRAGPEAEGGRRALVTLALSLAPNGFVTRVDPDRITLHRLSPQRPADDTAFLFP